MLVLSRKVGESLIIGSGTEAIKVVVTKIVGNRVTLGVEAPKEVVIRRGELQPFKSENSHGEQEHCVASNESTSQG